MKGDCEGGKLTVQSRHRRDPRVWEGIGCTPPTIAEPREPLLPQQLIPSLPEMGVLPQTSLPAPFIAGDRTGLVPRHFRAGMLVPRDPRTPPGLHCSPSKVLRFVPVISNSLSWVLSAGGKLWANYYPYSYFRFFVTRQAHTVKAKSHQLSPTLSLNHHHDL